MADFVADRERRAVTDRVYVGTTWGEFKRAMAALGVRDDDRLASIEYGIGLNGLGCVVRDDESDGIEIREVMA